MYEDSNIEIISYFQMEVAFTLKYKVLPKLLRFYTSTDIYWEDFKLVIRTGKGLYEPITIMLDTKSLVIFKTNRENDLHNIYMYYDKKLLTNRTDSYCDNIVEYDFISEQVCNPLVESLTDITERNLQEKYILDREVEKSTLFSKKDFKDWLSKLERFSKDIYRIYGYEVIFNKFQFMTLDFYTFARVGQIEVIIGENVFIFDYNQSEDSVRIKSNNRDLLYEHEGLVAVAKRLQTEKTYTLYDRKVLQKEKDERG